MKNIGKFQSLLLLMSATLGLTIGLTVMLARPSDLLASPVTSEQLQKIHSAWQPETVLYVPKSNPDSLVVINPDLIWSAQIDQTEVKYQQSHVLVTIDEPDFFETVEIGDQLQVVATNNGVYSFTILEVRNLDQDSLDLYLQLSTNHLVLIEQKSAWESWWDAKFRVVLAR